jgi:hypothetical protein
MQSFSCTLFSCVRFFLQGKTGSHFEPKTIPPPLTNKADWEINPLELEFTKAVIIGKVQILKHLLVDAII